MHKLIKFIAPVVISGSLFFGCSSPEDVQVSTEPTVTTVVETTTTFQPPTTVTWDRLNDHLVEADEAAAISALIGFELEQVNAQRIADVLCDDLLPQVVAGTVTLAEVITGVSASTNGVLDNEEAAEVLGYIGGVSCTELVTQVTQ